MHDSGTVSRQSPLAIEQLEDRLVPDATSFVTSLYQNLLDRAPDAAGLSLWVSKIQNGESNQQVATEIWGSAEHRGMEVDSFYQTFLNRSADAAGRAFWINQLTSGTMDLLTVQASFMLSSEFLAAHNTPAAFVTALYVDFLGRAPSIGEQAAWENILAANGALAVTAGIETSAEAYARVIDNYYQTYLNRAPDAAGLALWLSQLQTGQMTIGAVADAILGSTEYANSH